MASPSQMCTSVHGQIVQGQAGQEDLLISQCLSVSEVKNACSALPYASLDLFSLLQLDEGAPCPAGDVQG